MVFSVDVTFPAGFTMRYPIKDEKEFDKFQKLCLSRKKRGLLFGAFFVIRTDTWKNFVIDFTLPIVLVHAMKVNNTALRVFAVVGALVLDLSTFVFRAITLFPRFLDNKRRLPVYDQLIKLNLPADEHERVELSFRRKVPAEVHTHTIYFKDVPAPLSLI